jgi:hypothetical protein
MTAATWLTTFRILCPAGTDASAQTFLDDFFHRIPLSMALGIKALLFVFNWMPALVVCQFKPLNKLDVMIRDRYFAWWEHNRFYLIREGFNTLKTLALLARVGKDWEP